MVWVPSCPRPLADQCLLDAAIEFCRDTEVVEYRVGPMNVQAGVGDYTLPIPQFTRPARILSATFQGRALALCEETPLDGATGTPTLLATPTPETVSIYPAPDQTAALALYARVALEPTRDATVLPDELLHTWCEAVVAGAVMRITSIPDQAFSNPVQAAEAAARFRYGKSLATAEAGRQRIQTSAQVRARPLI